jgi:5-methylcytosine-specific restriction endonuclease McrA
MTQEKKRNDLFQCKRCNKWYCGKSGLSHHKKTCSGGPPAVNVTEEQPQLASSTTCLIQDQLQNQMKDMKEAFEKEKQNMKNELDAMKKEILKINKRIEKGETKTTTTPVHTKRRKINKDLRQQIADKQENACGSCKLNLTPYFQIDHTVGLQFGGTDEESNLMALCCECHAMKSIAENQCRKQIQEAIQTILTDKLGKRG